MEGDFWKSGRLIVYLKGWISKEVRLFCFIIVSYDCISQQRFAYFWFFLYFCHKKKPKVWIKNNRDWDICAIKHGSMRIVFDGKEIEVDPVEALEPATDYSRKMTQMTFFGNEYDYKARLLLTTVHCKLLGDFPHLLEICDAKVTYKWVKSLRRQKHSS